MTNQEKLRMLNEGLQAALQPMSERLNKLDEQIKRDKEQQEKRKTRQEQQQEPPATDRGVLDQLANAKHKELDAVRNLLLSELGE